MPNLRAHQSRGIVPKQQTLIMPMCPMTGILIPDGEGVYIVGFDPETKATKSFYVHEAAVFEDGHERKIYLEGLGLTSPYTPPHLHDEESEETTNKGGE